MSIKAEHLTYKYGDGTAFEQYALKDVPKIDICSPEMAM